jgi:3-oxosteroid 1-dehydrogenase
MITKASADSEAAIRYLKNLYPDIDGACLDGFMADAPRLVDFFISKHVSIEGSPDYPDYYQEFEGASTGRSVFPLVYEGPRKFRSLVRKTPPYFVPFTINEAMKWGTHRIGHWDKTLLAKRKLAGHLTMGRALVAFLLENCMEAGVDLSLNNNTDGLLIQDGQFVGAVVDGKKVSAGVGMLACGGFSHHPELMKRIAAVRPILSAAPEACDSGGGGLNLALDAGLKTGNPYCWWVPIMKLFGEDQEKPGPDLWAYHTTLQDRCWPGGIMVSSEGRRFTNESACYNTVGGILAKDPDPTLDRVWLVWGNYYVKNYIRGTTSYFQPAKKYMNKSQSVNELAGRIGVPLTNLKETIEHWNKMAAEEKDRDYGRGESLYDRYMGDQFRAGHPNIAPLVPPFQAVRLYPGTMGTKMGSVTDQHGRAQLEDGRVVSGLYAAGNAAASFFGDFYPGAGATLGQACVFGFRAARHACGSDS